MQCSCKDTGNRKSAKYVKNAPTSKLSTRNQKIKMNATKFTYGDSVRVLFGGETEHRVTAVLRGAYQYNADGDVMGTTTAYQLDGEVTAYWESELESLKPELQSADSV